MAGQAVNKNIELKREKDSMETKSSRNRKGTCNFFLKLSPYLPSSRNRNRTNSIKMEAVRKQKNPIKTPFLHVDGVKYLKDVNRPIILTGP